MKYIPPLRIPAQLTPAHLAWLSAAVDPMDPRDELGRELAAILRAELETPRMVIPPPPQERPLPVWTSEPIVWPTPLPRWPAALVLGVMLALIWWGAR